jgi:pSer/pThr/pTyr-binding forkhead associated (FHA) protein
MAYVVIFNRSRELQRIELGESNTFGRSSSCDIWIDDLNVSRRHCKVERTKSGWMLLDLDSTNGTWLEAARVRRYTLRDGETFYIGDARIVFHADQWIENRPADPTEAMEASRVMAKIDANAETTVTGGNGRPLPNPAATVASDSRAPRRHDPANPVPFRRPPARPIVKAPRSGGLLGLRLWRGAV